MTIAMIVTCDDRRPDRIPEKCRAFLVAPVGEAVAVARSAGWLIDGDTGDRCPSHQGRQ